MKYAKIKKCDVANGVGVRVSLFVSGCEHYCKGCFNSEAWDFSYGEDYDKAIEDRIIDLLSPSYISGLTLLGGEPMHPRNRAALLPLLLRVKQVYPQKDIWCYSGYTFEELCNQRLDDPVIDELFKCIDFLVDGRFDESLKSPNLRFKGSANQRIIDLQNTLSSGEIVLWEGEKDQEMSNAKDKNN